MAATSTKDKYDAANLSWRVATLLKCFSFSYIRSILDKATIFPSDSSRFYQSPILH